MTFAAVMAAGFSASAFNYECTGGSFDPVTVEVKSKSTLVINGKDNAKIDKEYAERNPEKKSYRLIGSFETLGDGSEGYSVSVAVSKHMFTGGNVAYLNTYVRGPDGYYSDSYKCVRAR